MFSSIGVAADPPIRLFFLLHLRQCTYFCLALLKATLGFIPQRKNLYGIPTTLCRGRDSNSHQQACTTFWDLNSGPLFQVSYRDCGNSPIWLSSERMAGDEKQVVILHKSGRRQITAGLGSCIKVRMLFSH